MDGGLYERQLKWREESKQKAAAAVASERKEDAATFTPKIYTVPVKKFEGTASQLNEKSGMNHVLRQNRARMEKEELKSGTHGRKAATSLLPIEMEQSMIEESPSQDANEVSHANGTYDSNMLQQEFAAQALLQQMDGLDMTDESIVMMLERERREWHTERMKLVHCIHLQQLELTQRAAAANERASEIAKEFARAIEGFEERLVSVENNVQKEIQSIRGIAESLQNSAKAQYTEQRLRTVEDGMSTIIQKLDTLLRSPPASSTAGLPPKPPLEKKALDVKTTN